MGIIANFNQKINNTGERTKKMLLGSGVMAISTLLNTLTRIGLISLLARIYTKDQFGIWVAITSATAVMATSDFGIGNALRNKLAVLRTEDENGDKEAQKLFLSVIYFFFVLTLLISALLFLCKDFIAYENVFKTNNVLLQQQGVYILIAVQVIFLIGIPISIGATMFFAYQESNFFAVFNIINGIASMVIVGACAYFGQSIVVTAILYFVVSLVINAIAAAYFMYRRKWKLIFINFSSVFSRVWSLLALSITFAVLQISGAFIYNSVTLIATSNISLADAAQLNLVQKLYTVIVTIYLSFYNPLWAGYIDAMQRNDWKWIRKTLTKTIQISLGIFVFAILAFLLFGNVFLKLLAGNNYVSNKQLFLSMGLWALCYSLYSMGVAFLSAASKINLITIFTALFAIAFVYFATSVSKSWGIIGISSISVFVYFLLSVITYLQAYHITNKSILYQSKKI